MCIECSQRLVEQQHRRSKGKCARQCHALLLAPRQLRRTPPFKSSEPNSLDHPLRRAFTVHPIHSLHAQSIGNVAEYVEMREQCVTLKDHANFSVPRRHCPDIPAIDQKAPSLHRKQARNKTEHRGLSTTACADHRKQFAGCNLERKRVNSLGSIGIAVAKLLEHNAHRAAPVAWAESLAAARASTSNTTVAAQA